MNYNVKWHEEALQDLKKLPKQMAKNIIDKVESYLIKNPVSLGKALKGLFSGLYRYRYSDYRIIYSIDETYSEIMILSIGHRKDVYKL
ncbi:MAG: type II toxin-antitoxin system RelE/ParE family toxin [Desulfobacterales bacterium]|nr:type II toxin-antitoxin system RelE/ParE family toxin [Desulfobacterales bacterium]MBF0399120.1 type II toxin-antitoxin system RelE/ParE family toxin [Desulfobacterales bacterium]